jgi:hypothetical protein
MPLLEIDAYRAAKMLVDQHGTVAAAVAIKVIQDARDQGDTEKQTAWQMVFTCYRGIATASAQGW